MTRDNKDLLVGLDIGTSKVVAIVAELHADGEIEVIGTGQHESNGLKKGVVVDIEKTVASIQAALEEAEITSGNKIQQVVTGIAGSHIRSFNSIGMVAIKDKEVTEADVARVIETAKAVAIPTDQQILHVLPQEFIIDGQEDIREPVGMSGVRLDVKVHVVTGAVSAVQNIIKCVRRCGLAVQDLILQPLASANAVLTHDEKELGVALVDIGGGTTDIAVVNDGGVEGTKMFGIGGRSFTRTIAADLDLSFKDAEKLKLNIDNENLKPSVKKKVDAAIDKTLEVWLSGVELALSDFDNVDYLPNRILLCGGGSSLQKITEALKTRRWPEDLPFTKKPVVQYINPSDITGIVDETGDISDHTFVTAMGLLRVGYDTIIGSQDGNSLVEKVNRLLKI